MKFRVRKFGFWFTVLALVLMMAGSATAHLLMAPTRVVFEGRQRSTTVLLMNTDNKAHTYRIGFKLMSVDDNGRYSNVVLDKDDLSAVPNMIRFSPRQVRIEANGRQSIRLSLRRPADLPKGEYRGHLVAETVPGSERKASFDSNGVQQEGLTFQLNVEFGISIPIIVRQGEIVPFGVSIGDISFITLDTKVKQVNQTLRIPLEHSIGAYSPFGTVSIFAVGSDGKEKLIGKKNNVAVYPEVERRLVDIVLRRPVAAGASLRIVYEGREEYTGRILAEKSITLN